MLGRDRAKMLAKLSTKKGRREQGAVLLDSMPLVLEGMELGLVEEVLHVPGEHPGLAAAAQRLEIPLTETTPELLAKVCHVETSPGIAAVARLTSSTPPERWGDGNGLLAVYLDRLADPGNLGTIARSAAAFGAHGLLLAKGCADPSSPKALRASAGALLRLPWVQGEPAGHADVLNSVWYRTVVRGGTSLAEIEPAPRAVLWLGSEAHGATASPPNAEVVDVTIPMSGATESLNVAAAAAVSLWELRR